MEWNQPPVVRVQADPERAPQPGTWPATIPAVAQVLRDGLELAPGITFLVGENGSGKSTLVEAVAVAYGLSPEGGTAHGHHSTRRTESPLADALRLQRGIGAGRWGFFLRAETMHGWYTFAEEAGSTPSAGGSFHELSHGESFIAVLERYFDSPGLYCLDEPEAALSFSSSLSLIGVLDDLARRGGQVLCATHSPLLAALPGARILEVGEWGIRETAWEDLELVAHWRSFLEMPGRYLRHVVGS